NEEIANLTKRKMHFFVGPRPGKKSIDTLTALNLTHCCTLLSEREDAQAIGKICQRLGIKWIWLAMDGGRVDVLRQMNMGDHIRQLSREIGDEPEPRIYFHCSAGIHRTGFFVYFLLRLTGLERAEALAELTDLRPVTAEQVGDERLDLADEMVVNFGGNAG
ncbi:MAG: protein-tyrosine phosphatase family protein, partial [Hyphomicrobiaceae bacterium]